jgi:hypothetical protein
MRSFKLRIPTQSYFHFIDHEYLEVSFDFCLAAIGVLFYKSSYFVISVKLLHLKQKLTNQQYGAGYLSSFF